ncbi:MAG: hypothetical protein IKD62_05435, partial [Oscillospiraceae bacterium]|nr:hypothetical protein [Oscillospiraceae bacterium]
MQERNPALIAAGDLLRRLISHLRIKLHFARHEPTSLQKNKPVGSSNRLCTFYIHIWSLYSPAYTGYYNRAFVAKAERRTYKMSEKT